MRREIRAEVEGQHHARQHHARELDRVTRRLVLPADEAGDLVVTSVRAINRAGQIAGVARGRTTGALHPVLLVPGG